MTAATSEDRPRWIVDSIPALLPDHMLCELTAGSWVPVARGKKDDLEAIATLLNQHAKLVHACHKSIDAHESCLNRINALAALLHRAEKVIPRHSATCLGGRGQAEGAPCCSAESMRREIAKGLAK